MSLFLLQGVVQEGRVKVFVMVWEICLDFSNRPLFCTFSWNAKTCWSEKSRPEKSRPDFSNHPKIKKTHWNQKTYQNHRNFKKNTLKSENLSKFDTRSCVSCVLFLWLVMCVFFCYFHLLRMTWNNITTRIAYVFLIFFWLYLYPLPLWRDSTGVGATGKHTSDRGIGTRVNFFSEMSRSGLTFPHRTVINSK